MSSEEPVKSLSVDYLNLLINGQALADVAFAVEGRIVHAHRCVLAARSHFFRKFFCGLDPSPCLLLDSCYNQQQLLQPLYQQGEIISCSSPPQVIRVRSIRYDVFMLMLQFLYSGQATFAAPKNAVLPGCGQRGCHHTCCTATVDFTLDALAAARSFELDQLALLVQVSIFLHESQLQILSHL